MDLRKGLFLIFTLLILAPLPAEGAAVAVTAMATMAAGMETGAEMGTPRSFS